jgi:hypothetical protein
MAHGPKARRANIPTHRHRRRVALVAEVAAVGARHRERDCGRRAELSQAPSTRRRLLPEMSPVRLSPSRDAGRIVPAWTQAGMFCVSPLESQQLDRTSLHVEPKAADAWSVGSGDVTAPAEWGANRTDTLSTMLARVVEDRAKSLRPREPVLARFAKISSASPLYPQKWHYSSWLRDSPAAATENFFTHQEAVGGRFFDASNNPHLVHSPDADLLVSDNGDMAIEDTAGEPKTFFATAALISASNSALEGAVRLERTSRYLWNNNVRLFEVEPVVASKGQRGLDLTGPQRCNEMAEFVTGKRGMEISATWQAHQLMAAVLDTLRPEDNWEAEWASLKAVYNPKTYGAFLDRLVVLFQRYIRDPAAATVMEAALTDRLANTALDPQLGTAISTFGVGTGKQEQYAKAVRRDLFSYHFATVVAKSGSDFVTLENYARNDPVVRLTTGSSGDPLFFFRMYNTQVAADTWHAKQLATNSFLGAKVSFQVA